MRNILRSFAVLDLLSLVLLVMQLWVNVSKISTFNLWAIQQAFNLQTLENKINAVLMFSMFVLILIGAHGFFFRKKTGYILYYIQFPFRLYLWIFTLGFITLLPEALNYYGDTLINVLLKFCFVFEFIRLYIVIRAHMNRGVI